VAKQTGGVRAGGVAYSPCSHLNAALSLHAALRNSEGQFQETAPRKTAENTVKHSGGGVGSVVANHRGSGESSMVVTTLLHWPPDSYTTTYPHPCSDVCLLKAGDC